MEGEKVETVADFILGGSKITADGDCSHEIKRHLLLRRKAVTNQDSVLKNRDITLGFSRWCSDNKPAYQCRRHRRHGFNPWVRKIPPLMKKWQPNPVILPDNVHGHGSLLGYSSWGYQELDLTELMCFADKGPYIKAVVFPGVMCGCEGVGP